MSSFLPEIASTGCKDLKMAPVGGVIPKNDNSGAQYWLWPPIRERYPATTCCDKAGVRLQSHVARNPWGLNQSMRFVNVALLLSGFPPPPPPSRRTENVENLKTQEEVTISTYSTHITHTDQEVSKGHLFSYATAPGIKPHTHAI